MLKLFEELTKFDIKPPVSLTGKAKNSDKWSFLVRGKNIFFNLLGFGPYWGHKFPSKYFIKRTEIILTFGEVHIECAYIEGNILYGIGTLYQIDLI